MTSAARGAAAAALAAAAAVVAGCARQPVRVWGDPSTGSVRAERGVALGWAPKRVVSKQSPGTLVANDGTACRVDAARWERTKVGRTAACSWQLVPAAAADTTR